MLKYLLISIFVIMLVACSNNDEALPIDEDKLGIIDSDVESEETNLKTKAKYGDNIPGNSLTIDRAFENAPPMIPHTTQGFLPIKIKNNICLSCHMPDKAEEVNAIPLPETHFTKLRPDMIDKDGVYEMVSEELLTIKKLENFNNEYFNCTQCHVPLTNVAIDIKNLFTPEFREEFGLEKSDLIDRIAEGVKKK